MSGLSSAIANGFSQLFKQGRKRIGNAVDNYLLDAEARKAISDEVGKKFQPMIDKARRYESKRADNIKDLDAKLTQSKKDLVDAQADWNKKYADALADAKTQRQKDIADYGTNLQGYKAALDNANKGKQSIVDQLAQQEAKYTPTKTIYIDVNSGDRYLVHPVTGEYKNITQIFKNAPQNQQRQIARYMKGFDERLIDNSSGTPKVINAFDEATFNSYHGKNNIFDSYLDRVEAPKRIDLRNADNQITKANSDLNSWQTNNPNPPSALDEKQFLKDYRKTNGSLPNEYSFNGQTYKDAAELDKAYKDALAHEQSRQGIASRTASGYASKRDAEIAQRIQDAKDIKKAKLALGAGAGAGALFAGAKALYGGDDTDNTDNIDTTDNTNYGEPDPNFNVENIPEGQAQLKSDTESINTGFDPDKADALAAAAYDKGVEDGNAVRSSDDLGNNIAASTGGHTMDDRLFELIKAMQDPYKADAVANYIYSRRGNDPELQRLGWRAWLNKYYGDSLRSKMGIDPSGYKGMHISGGL